MVAISNAITNSPILERNLEEPASAVIVELPSVIIANPVFEINRLPVMRGDRNKHLYLEV
jgi:hypothetical protein